ncbi:hypothetical protein AS594_33930 [Streptomyces agglomeratus]|uniref:Uncharacterized protein n=1 Tax=Streptomyces agglomeratus TaxID=285458 RepID=A0A1E5PK25_9ACTN|nr:hypothetical protein AS594_33930 [Streptomyces agglomeratus]OEJ55379.1 hypothetical protein BGK72_02155 [Streptomyces agglomeratus]
MPVQGPRAVPVRVDRGVATLIPQSSAPASSADLAMAALAALQTVSVHVGVLQAAVALLEETAVSSDDEAVNAAAQRTVAMLRSALVLQL